jgi:hypothetical protein
MNATHQRLLIVAQLVVLVVLAGFALRYLLAPQPVVVEQTTVAPVTDSFGCNPPPSAVFTKLGLDVSVASATYSDLLLGKIDVKTDPVVIDLVGRASREATVRDYLRCLALARDKFTAEQASYTDRFNAFMVTSPTPEQFIQWQKDNPFPKKITLVERTVDACGLLRVTAEWQGMDAPEQRQTCNYSAPQNCKILWASTERKSDSNGSSSLSVNPPDNKSLTATVTARPHGMALDRKRGWMEVRIVARLQCEEQGN